MVPVPGRQLPEVRVVSGPVDSSVRRVVTRPADPDRQARGHAAEARVTELDGRPVVEVELDDRTPRPGWSGAVDTGLGHRRAGAALARALTASRGPRDTPPGDDDEVVLEIPETVPRERLGDLVLGYLLGALRQDVRAARPAPVAPRLTVAVGPGDTASAAEVAAAVESARATATARDLAGTPSDVKTPEWLTSRMSELLSGAGMRTDVLAGDRLAEIGAGGLLAVGAGSVHGPRMLLARRPGPGPRVLLVGKGVTFDTGGISVKPADGMHLMRTDMAGSAAVVSAAAAFCSSGRAGDEAIDLTVVVPSAENMLSGSAYRPGDVITHVDGATTEVTNTDAEGRMLLADALAHGVAVADPDLVVDVATLTGAMKVALGMRTGAVLANDDDLADRVAAAGARAGERWWRLPLPQEYRSAVRSTLADRRQAPAGPGAITAALFLEGFVDGRPWAHLDIAGPARSPEEIDEVGPVATGFATRTLLGLLRGLVDRPRS